MLSAMAHFSCSILLLFICNRLLGLALPNKRDCEINIFTEKYKMKKGYESVTYGLVILLIQNKLSQGFNEPCWYLSYFYQGFVVYRTFGWLENFVPASLKPFPYVNLWSSSNIVLWVNIGRELGLNTNPMIFTALTALYLYIQFMK